MDVSEDFRAFVVARQRSLLQTAWLLTGDWATSEDLVQAALSRAWPRWERISKMEAPEAYVRRIMVNRALDWRHRRWSGEQPTAWLPEALAEADDVELRFALLVAVQALPRRQRAVIALRYFNDMSEADTAIAMSCSRGTVKSQLSKGLATLRRDPVLSGLTLHGSTT